MADVFAISIDKLVGKKDKKVLTAENDLVDNFDNIEKKIFDAVKKKINTMNVEGGKISFDDKNTAIVNEIDAVIQNALQGSNYPTQVKDFLRSFETIKQFNFDAQKSVNDISEKELSDLINPIQKANVEQTLDGLTGTGVSKNFIQPVREGIYKNIVAGTTISDLETYLTNYILSNPERMSGLKRYVTQVSRDSLNQFDGQVNSQIAETFGLDAFRYVGSLIDDSRPQCVRWVGKNVLLLDDLQNEINWANNNGTGMIPGTTPNNFAVFRGGYNCRHSAIPFKLTKSQRAELGIQQAEQQVETNQKTDLQIKELKGGESVDSILKKIRQRQTETKKIDDSLFFTSQNQKTIDAMNEIISNNDSVVELINKKGTLIALRNEKESTLKGGFNMTAIDGSKIPTFSTIDTIPKKINGNCEIGNSFLNIKILPDQQIAFKKYNLFIDKNQFDELINGGAKIEFEGGKKILVDQNDKIIAYGGTNGKWKYWSVSSVSRKIDKNIAPTITHETAHFLQNNYDSDKLILRKILNKNELSLLDAPTSLGQANVAEFWTESLTSYIYDNEGLKNNHPKVFKFVKEYLNEIGVDINTIKLAE